MKDQNLWHDVYVALGSNVGNREQNLKTALHLLTEEKNRLRLTNVSRLYETMPVGYTHQGDFLNAVCRLQSTLEPFELLKVLQKIELQLGRKREIHWGPRTLDLDLLLYDELEISSETLTIPHPRMFERAFVLIPLRDVYPYDNIRGQPFAKLIENCEDKYGVVAFA